MSAATKMRVRMLVVAGWVVRNRHNVSKPWTCTVCNPNRNVKDAEQHFRGMHLQRWQEAVTQATISVGSGRTDWRTDL